MCVCIVFNLKAGLNSPEFKYLVSSWKATTQTRISELIGEKYLHDREEERD